MTTQEKIDLVNRNNPLDCDYKVTDRVHCIHCGEEYFAHELQVILEDGTTWVLCKHYPECDGTVLDMFDAESWHDAQGRYLNSPAW